MGRLIYSLVLGGGRPFLPPLEEPQRLQLVDASAFASGVRLLAYRPTP
jgi:hypothetical protein